MFNAEEDLLAVELLCRARLAGAVCSAKREVDASPEGLGRLDLKSLFWPINTEQISFSAGSVAFPGASFLTETGILKCIMPRDPSTVNLPSEGDLWGACLSLPQPQQSPRAAGGLLAPAAMAGGRGAGAG